MSSLLSYFPQFDTTDSLFQKMVTLGAPWTTEQGLNMDISYFTMWSGVHSPSVFTRLHSTNSLANTQEIAKILWNIYGANWRKLWNSFNTDYNPINNYNIDETVDRTQKDDRTIDKTGSLESTVNGNDNQTTKETIDQTVTLSSTGKVTEDATGTSTLEHGENIQHENQTDAYKYAFNSTQKVPVAVDIANGTETHSGTDTTTTKDDKTTDSINNSTTTTSGTNDGTFEGTTKDTRTDSTKDSTIDNDQLTENITRTRTGNVGQNSYQELLRQEFELWKWNFFEQVFRDVDKFLITAVFDTCNFS